MKHLGIKVDEAKEGYARLSLDYDEKLIRIMGFIHGGVIATIVDVACCYVGNNNLKRK